MPSMIRILDEITINQIAAGEVIENPSSVIKELVENALDAEATSIFIDVEASGRHRILVKDNGIGMGRDDALLCFERHATSKVAKIEDLEVLSSMGFRGEALPSIASIARVRLFSRPRDQEMGTLVEIQGGKILLCAEVPCDVGTSIEVTDLFYNVPARKKFLKSPKADLFEIQKMMTEIAFGNRLVHFTLNADGESLLDVPLAETHLIRAKQLLNEAIFESMRVFEYQEEKILVEGLLGDPSLHRPNRTGQSLFLNQRPIHSWEIAQAVLEGYGTSLPERRYPLFYLHLTLPPHEFDINVHPQKKEVRFSHLSHLKEVIRRGISQGLTWKTPIKVFDQPPTIYPTFESKPLLMQEKPLAPYFEKERYLPLEVKTPKILAIVPYYIFLEEVEGALVVDIQKARKRICHEEILKVERKQEKQCLLLPLSLNLSNEEKQWIKDHQEVIEKAGFTIENERLHAIPSLIKEEEAEAILQEMMKGDSLTEIKLRKIPRENRVLSEMEAVHLIKALYACQQSHFTPSGQKIVTKVLWSDFERFFQ